MLEHLRDNLLLCIVWAIPMFSIIKDFFESSLYSAGCS